MLKSVALLLCGLSYVLAANFLAIHNFPPAKLYRVDVSTMNISQSHDLPLYGTGAPRVAGALDQVSNHWYVSTATKDAPTPHLTQWNAHDLSVVKQHPMTKGAIMALQWAHGNLWAIGFNETQHEDDGVPTFMRVDLTNNHLITICQGRDDLSFSHASTVDESVWLLYAQFFDLWTAFLDPYMVTCDLRSGQSSYVALGGRLQSMLAVPTALFGNNTADIPASVRHAPNAQGVLIAVQEQLIVTIDPRTGVLSAVVRLPVQPIYPNLALGPQGQVYLLYGNNNLSVRSLVTINLQTKTVSNPINHDNLTGEDFESVVFDSNP